MTITSQDKDTFIEAYNTHADAIFRHCYFRLGSNRMRAEDATQEVFLRTWKYIAQEHPVRHIRAFLYQVASRVLLNEYKKRTEQSLDALCEQGFEVEDARQETLLEDIDKRRAVTLVETLDPDQRDTVIMRYVEDMPLKEIAKIRGESTNAVSLRLRRALRNLQSLLARRQMSVF